MSELPQGWAVCKIGTMFRSFSGGTPNKNKASYWNGHIPWISSGEFKSGRISQGTHFITTEGLENSSAKLCRPGSVLVVVRSGILKHTLPVAMVGRELAINQDIKCFDSGDDDINRWLLLSLKARSKELLSQNREGTTVQSVKYDTLKEFEFPLPPANEQRRIVAKLEMLLTKVDVCKERLDKIPSLLKRFRQSLLAAACSGRLTTHWREKHGDIESASQLLRRLLAERSRKWEQAQQEHNRPKRKYREPAPPDVTELLELPAGWIWTNIDSLVFQIEAGSNFACVEHPPGIDEVGVAKISAVTWGRYNEQESKTCTDARRIKPRLLIKAGDFLFSRANTIELVGACVIAEATTKRIMLSDKVLRFRFVSVLPRWVLYFLQNPTGRKQIENLATGNQQSMRNIGQDRIREIAIPLPALKELKEIVSQVEQLLRFADQIETRYRKATEYVGDLIQSILAKAFRGELVPQDPSDEPASLMLQRIQDKIG